MRRRWAAALAVGLSAAFLASCSYSYDDGLPPLGSRETPSTTPTPNPTFPRQRDLLQPSQGTAETPPQDWTPDMLTSWADATLPDTNGISFAFGYGIALSDQPVLATAAVPAGTLVVEYACRGADTAHLTLSAGGTALVDSDYACGRVWVRIVVFAKDSVAEVRSSPSAAMPAVYAFRIIKR